MAKELPFDEFAPAERADGEPSLVVDVDGFEGPLDLLLELARRQKVDLTKISILAWPSSISSSWSGRGRCGWSSPPIIS